MKYSAIFVHFIQIAKNVKSPPIEDGQRMVINFSYLLRAFTRYAVKKDKYIKKGIISES